MCSPYCYQNFHELIFIITFIAPLRSVHHVADVMSPEEGVLQKRQDDQTFNLRNGMQDMEALSPMNTPGTT